MDDLFDESLLITTGKRARVIDYVPEIDIYRHYWPDMKMGTQKNPFKIELKSPSFSLHEKNEEGRLKWKDHSSGEAGDIYDFVTRWYKKYHDKDIAGFVQVNDIIWRDMNLNEKELMPKDLLFSEEQMGLAGRRKKDEGSYQINVVDTGWTKWSIGYWITRYGICPQILDDYYCGHAKEVWVTPPKKATYLWGVSTERNPIFYFHFPRTGHTKCYAPFATSKKNKWIMNCDNLTDIQGYDQMNIKQNRPKFIIFTKAMKEVMFYRSFHINAIAIHGESHHFHPDFIRHIKKYSDHQFSLYDNDYPGRKSAYKLKLSTGIEPFLIQGAKNITDLWENNPSAVWKYVDLLKERYE